MFRELGLRARAKKQHAKLIKQSKQAQSQSGEGQLAVVDAAAEAAEEAEVETIKATLSDAIGQEPARVYMTFENLSYTVCMRRSTR
jgi:hypothetical protein